MPFLKGIYHSYSSDNEMIIKMNDTYDRYFFTMYHLIQIRTVSFISVPL